MAGAWAERDVGEPRLRVVAAAHIRVDACEPDLLDGLSHLLQRIVRGDAAGPPGSGGPERGREHRAGLVDGVLNEWPIDQSHDFLRHRLGCRKKSRT